MRKISDNKTKDLSLLTCCQSKILKNINFSFNVQNKPIIFALIMTNAYQKYEIPEYINQYIKIDARKILNIWSNEIFKKSRINIKDIRLINNEEAYAMALHIFEETKIPFCAFIEYNESVFSYIENIYSFNYNAFKINIL